MGKILYFYPVKQIIFTLFSSPLPPLSEKKLPRTSDCTLSSNIDSTPSHKTVDDIKFSRSYNVIHYKLYFLIYYSVT